MYTLSTLNDYNYTKFNFCIYIYIIDSAILVYTLFMHIKFTIYMYMLGRVRARVCVGACMVCVID